MDQIDRIALLISEDVNDVKRYFAAVAVARWRGKWLLGLSKADDDRRFRWVFPGGGIESGENPEQAAVRECREETNAHSRAIGKPFEVSSAPGVAFVPCVLTRPPKLISKADEFVAIGLFSPAELRQLKRVYHNVRELITTAGRVRA